MDLPFFDHVIHYKQLDSSLLKAKQMITNREIQGNFLIIAEKQTTGLGRKENYWHSPEKGLWFTAGLYNLPVKNSITLFTGLCIINAICALFPQLKARIGIKWPNDIMIDSKKVAGILTNYHPSFNYLLIGVGINTNNDDFPDDLVDIAASLNSFAGKTIDHLIFLKTIFTCFNDFLSDYLENELSNFLTEYHQYSILENKVISLDTEFNRFTGEVKGINKEGALLLKLDNGYIQPFFSGTIVKE